MPPNNEYTTQYIEGEKQIYLNNYHFEKFTIKADTLEMGVYLKSRGTFVTEMKYNSSIFIIDFYKLRIGIKFFIGDHTFLSEMDFKNLDGEIHVEQRMSLRSITIASKFPPKYWIYDQKKNILKRMVRTHGRKNKGPLQPHMSDNSEQLGKWVVYRITFDLMKFTDYEQKRFRKMFEKTREFNLTPINFKNPLKVVSGGTMEKHVKRSGLHFDVLYMMECIVSFNYIHDYDLNKEFFSLLAKENVQNALHILKKIYDGKKRIYDPLSYLTEEIKKLEGVFIKQINVPKYCSMMRKVVVTPTTMYMLPPTMETSNRVIRHFKDKKDNFLRVHFSDEGSCRIGSANGDRDENYNDALYNRIYNTLVEGIKIGDVRFEFLAFSSSQLRDHSCWFFASTEGLKADDIRNWMGDFSNEKTVAKYAARMGQCFSSTRAIQRLLVNDIEEIPDIKINGYTFSDGIGKISSSLARKIAKELELKNVPSAFQFRMAGYKGMLCQSNFLREDQVQVRGSQRKFASNHNVLEVIRCSSYIPAYLNRQAITLLSVLGIPDQVFIDLMNQQVNELNKIIENENTAIKVLQQNVDEYSTSRSLAELVKAGFLKKGKEDPYLLNMISLFRISMMRDLKKKAKIRVGKGTFLIGVLDETKTLKENQVYCRISDSFSKLNNGNVITGKCIVYRNPCFHPGDIRIVEAVDCEALSHLVDVVVFPAVGDRDIPNQCSGGDLDGDDFTLIYDERLIPREVHEPMNYSSQLPEIVERVTMDDIKKFFVNYVYSDQLGKIANAHLALADLYPEGALHNKCIELAQLHSDAVDFPKTGVPASFPSGLRAKSFPDFMEKPDKRSHPSKKVLGTLYRSIKEEEYKPYELSKFDERLKVEGYEKHLKDARNFKRAYDADIKGIMNQYGVMTEFEVISGYIVNTITNIDKKKPRDLAKSVMDATTAIKKHYRKLFDNEFYDEENKMIPDEAFEQMKSKAYAWYYVTYHHSELSDNDENMITFPWIVDDLLSKILIINQNRDAMKKVLIDNNLIERQKAEKAFQDNNNNSILQQKTEKPMQIENNSNIKPIFQSEDINEDLERLKELLS